MVAFSPQEETQGRVQESGVDALSVHVLDAVVGIKTALDAFGVRKLLQPLQLLLGLLPAPERAGGAHAHHLLFRSSLGLAPVGDLVAFETKVFAPIVGP